MKFSNGNRNQQKGISSMWKQTANSTNLKIKVNIEITENRLELTMVCQVLIVWTLNY